MPSGTGATPAVGAGSPAESPPPAASSAAPNPIPVTTAPPKPKKLAPPPPPLETALSSDPTPTVQPNTFFATAKASERYGAIVDAGGWPTDIVPLHPGAKGPAVAELRKRLAIEGDLDASHASGQAWDAELTGAIKRFQARMGLRETGVVAGATLKSINVPAKVRFNEIASSANRLAGASFPFGERYVVVNLPSTSVEAIDN
jgi:L,D-transpeptidase YcbB